MFVHPSRLLIGRARPPASWAFIPPPSRKDKAGRLQGAAVTSISIRFSGAE